MFVFSSMYLREFSISSLNISITFLRLHLKSNSYLSRVLWILVLLCCFSGCWMNYCIGAYPSLPSNEASRVLVQSLLWLTVYLGVFLGLPSPRSPQHWSRLSDRLCPEVCAGDPRTLQMKRQAFRGRVGYGKESQQ